MTMTEMNVSELSGAALDWAVASATGLAPEMRGATPVCESTCFVGKFPVPPFSGSWSMGGPLLDSHCKGFGCLQDGLDNTWRAFGYDHDYTTRIATGPSILIAACRAIVTARLGETVSIPAELAEVQS